MTYLPSLKRGTLLDIFQRHPAVADSLHACADAVMRAESPFPPGERELMGAFVSRLNGCEFCEASHGHVAEHFGFDPGVVENLAQSIESASIKPSLKPVFDYLGKLTRGPHHVGEKDVQAILDAGWSEDAVIYANLVCGFFSLMNRLVEGLGLGSDPRTVQAAAQLLYEHGYSGVSTAVGDLKTSSP